MRIIVDTDAGTDDFLAIAYLLSLPGVRIEAITVVHGLAHVEPGARNLRRLLKLAGREDIPVFEGEEYPLRTSHTFPAAWRKMTDELGAVSMPPVSDSRPPENAVAFLKRRLMDRHDPATILALGPLTNLALASGQAAQPAVRQIVTMGGAVEVPGNLFDGNPGGANGVAEWNIYCDPDAAARVFALPVPQVMIGLDATNRVPIGASDVRNFSGRELSTLGRLAADVLGATLHLIMSGLYYAWDPLAAMALVDPSVVEVKGADIEVVTEGREIGRTALLRWNPMSHFKVAVDADAGRFRSEFERTFEKQPGPRR